MNTDQTIKDSVQGGWVERMPEPMRPYLRLSRYDRPIGFWLLALPGWIGLCFAALSVGFSWADVKWAVLIAIGAVAMRGAGCTYNDIVDRDLDAKVERTALRPLPAGSVTVKQAWFWLVMQCLVGLAVLAFFPRLAQIIALSSVVLVAAYPFMKRITYWPQAWLGLTFNWAVLVAYAAKTGMVNLPLFLLYAGLVFWTIGYDTIYACQDVEDDALIGVKSTARLFGDKVRLGIGVCYLMTIGCIFISLRALHLNIYEMESEIELIRGSGRFHGTEFMFPGTLAPILCISLFSLHLLWQVLKFNPAKGVLCLNVFKSNRTAGLLLILGLAMPSLANLL